LNYTYQNPETKECYTSLNDCFTKENQYFFNKYCYKTQCPENTVPLLSKNETIQEYFKTNLLLKDEIKSKICICNTSAFFWRNHSTDFDEFIQECLNECPEGYFPDPIARLCIKKTEIEIDTTQKIDNIKTEFSIISTNLDKEQIMTNHLSEIKEVT
jgi:hypothetical protein